MQILVERVASLDTPENWHMNKVSGLVVLPLLPISGKTNLDEVRREKICSMKVVWTFYMLLDRQIEEAFLIHRSKSDILLSRMEGWLFPVTYMGAGHKVLCQAQAAVSLDGQVQMGRGGRGEQH